MASTKVCNVRFDDNVITTTVTASSTAVQTWLNEVLSVHRCGLHKPVGLDVKWLLGYTAILQLCVGHHCLILAPPRRPHPQRALGIPQRPQLHVRRRGRGGGRRAAPERLQPVVVAKLKDLAKLATQMMGRSDLRDAGL